MKKLIISLAFAISLPLCQVAKAQETEITETFSDAEITELQQNICNNSEVNEILSTNQPYKTVLTDGTLVTSSSGNYTVGTISYNDDDDDGGGTTVKVVEATKVDTTIMADPSDPSAQQAITNICI